MGVLKVACANVAICYVDRRFGGDRYAKTGSGSLGLVPKRMVAPIEHLKILDQSKPTRIIGADPGVKNAVTSFATALNSSSASRLK